MILGFELPLQLATWHWNGLFLRYISFKRKRAKLEVLPRCLLSDFWVLSHSQYKAKGVSFLKNSSRACAESFLAGLSIECLHSRPVGVATPGQFILLSASGLAGVHDAVCASVRE
jgi:hypothetical protein